MIIVDSMWQDGQIRGSRMGELGSEDEEEERAWAEVKPGNSSKSHFERLLKVSKGSEKPVKALEKSFKLL